MSGKVSRKRNDLRKASNIAGLVIEICSELNILTFELRSSEKEKIFKKFYIVDDWKEVYHRLKAEKTCLEPG